MIYSSKSFFSFRVERVEVQGLALDGAGEGGEVERARMVEGLQEKEEEF